MFFPRIGCEPLGPCSVATASTCQPALKKIAAETRDAGGLLQLVALTGITGCTTTRFACACHNLMLVLVWSR